MVTRQRTMRSVALRWAPLLIAGAVLLLAPWVLTSFRLQLLGKFLTYAMVALALDLIWGYGGMLSLGHGLFFALGGYAMAMYLKLEASGGKLPDFMSWSGRETLPGFWAPFHSPVFAIAMTVLGPALLAALIGYLIFRSRIQGVYFSIITQALTLMAMTLFIGQQAVTGGTNGITNLKTIMGLQLADKTTKVGLYMATVIALGLVYLLCRRLTESRYGRLLVAMRDDENRVRFLGHNPVILKTVVFAISAGIAGLAGALFVGHVGTISPSQMAVVPSVEIVIWVAVGGRGTLAGAVLGALLVSYGKSSFSESNPETWQYFFGALFIGSVLLFPSGLVGTAKIWLARLPGLRRSLRTAGGGIPIEPEPAES